MAQTRRQASSRRDGCSSHEGRVWIYLDLDGDLNNSIRSSPTRFVWGPAKDRVIAPNSRVLKAALETKLD